MKPNFASLAFAAALISLASSAFAEDAPIDYNRAKEIFQRRKAGETVSPEDEAYLRRAMAERGKGGAKAGASATPETSTAPVADPKMVAALVPLDELKGSYKGEDGGLYGGGRNTPPAPLAAAYRQESAKIQPLGEDGSPAANGKIVLLSLGMSNTTMEFTEFVHEAEADSKKSAKVVPVDGAIGGRTAMAWAADGRAMLPQSEQQRLEKLLQSTGHGGLKGETWSTVEQRLKEHGVTAKQVQAIWLKEAEAMPAHLGEFPDHARVLEENLIDMLQIAQQRYPNLRVVFLSSRIFGGYAISTLNPEPYAYEEAFSMRWLIQKQAQGDPRLNYDAAKGPVKAPLAVWGPYLWANGATPRQSDGLVWKEDDFVTKDRTHPADSARAKVAGLLLHFFETDPEAQRWFSGKDSVVAK